KIITENILGSPFPVELSFFNATVLADDVFLHWRTETEIDNYGFDVERTVPLNPPEVGKWEKIGFVNGYGNSNSPREYSFIDESSEVGTQIYYRLKQIDNDGTYEYSPVVTAEIEAPSSFHLSQNYPNPFNPGTTIDFALPRQEAVLLKVYNLLGELIQVLINRAMPTGIHSVIFNAANFPSGVYIYRLEAGSNSATKQMIILK
ncbi:MAG: T9SS type A sorting domain-containing protein, partial [Ignavibacterium sp.]